MLNIFFGHFHNPPDSLFQVRLGENIYRSIKIYVEERASASEWKFENSNYYRRGCGKFDYLTLTIWVICVCI